MATTVSALLAEASELEAHEARRLLVAAADRSMASLVAAAELGDDVADRFRTYVARRRDGEPLQYIEGTAQFGPVDLIVDTRVLIPRPETEQLFELAVDKLGGIPAPTVLDLCTGSGNLALAVKHAVPDARVVATDISADAVAVAAANADRLGLHIEVAVGDLFAAVPVDLLGSVDLIISNPPYVTRDECALLPAEVAHWEPVLALDGGSDGLDVLRRIADDALEWLRPGGWFLCEIGERHGVAVERLFAAYRPEIRRDLAGRDRFLLGSAPMADHLH